MIWKKSKSLKWSWSFRSKIMFFTLVGVDWTSSMPSILCLGRMKSVSSNLESVWNLNWQSGWVLGKITLSDISSSLLILLLVVLILKTSHLLLKSKCTGWPWWSWKSFCLTFISGWAHVPWAPWFLTVAAQLNATFYFKPRLASEHSV